MKHEPVTPCHHHAGALRTFAAKNPHTNIDRMRADLWRGCCRYWNRRGIPKGWWV